MVGKTRRCLMNVPAAMYLSRLPLKSQLVGSQVGWCVVFIFYALLCDRHTDGGKSASCIVMLPRKGCCAYVTGFLLDNESFSCCHGTDAVMIWPSEPFISNVMHPGWRVQSQSQLNPDVYRDFLLLIIGKYIQNNQHCKITSIIWNSLYQAVVQHFASNLYSKLQMWSCSWGSKVITVYKHHRYTARKEYKYWPLTLHTWNQRNSCTTPGLDILLSYVLTASDFSLLSPWIHLNHDNI